MKKYSIEWTEMVKNNCYVEIEADSREEALSKWQNGEYDDYERDESSNSFEEPELSSVREVK